MQDEFCRKERQDKGNCPSDLIMLWYRTYCSNIVTCLSLSLEVINWVPGIGSGKVNIVIMTLITSPAECYLTYKHMGTTWPICLKASKRSLLEYEGLTLQTPMVVSFMGLPLSVMDMVDFKSRAYFASLAMKFTFSLPLSTGVDHI